MKKKAQFMWNSFYSEVITAEENDYDRNNV